MFILSVINGRTWCECIMNWERHTNKVYNNNNNLNKYLQLKAKLPCMTSVFVIEVTDKTIFFILDYFLKAMICICIHGRLSSWPSFNIELNLIGCHDIQNSEAAHFFSPACCHTSTLCHRISFSYIPFGFLQ